MNSKNFKLTIILVLMIFLGSLPSVVDSNSSNKFIVINDINTVDRVVVFSLDAFRYDYLLKTGDLPTFQWLMSEGVTAAYNIPSNPTLTAVNHVSIITGNHPEKHGVMGNTFYDWEDNESYSLFSDSEDPYRNTSTGLHLLTSEPSVIHAEQAGIKTAVLAWPYVDYDTYYEGLAPTYVYDYDYIGDLPGSQRTDRGICNILANTLIDDPDIGLAYAWLPAVDSAGHYSGVDSSTLDTVLGVVDTALRNFCERLETAGLLENTVIILTSDHGMAEVTDSYFFLEDKQYFLDAKGNTSLTPYLAHDAPLEYIYFIGETDELKAEEFASYLRGQDGIEAVYVNDENVAINLGHLKRQMNISVFLEPGTSRNFGSPYVGMHGYLNNHTEMQGIFIAAGPGIAEGDTIGGVDIRDIAPTTLDLLESLSDFGADGSPLTSIYGSRSSPFSFPDMYAPTIKNIGIISDSLVAGEELLLSVEVAEFGTISTAEAEIVTNIDTTPVTVTLEDLGSNLTFYGTIGPFELNEEVTITVTIEDSIGLVDTEEYTFTVTEEAIPTDTSLSYFSLFAVLFLIPILRRKK